MSLHKFFFVGSATASFPAFAHVKWFASIGNGASSPLCPADVMFSSNFISVAVVALVIMLIVSMLDRRLSCGNGFTAQLAASIEGRITGLETTILRFGVAAYFIMVVLYFSDAPIILTPELRTESGFIPALQIAIAVSALSRRSSLIAALGIALLYVYSVMVYGWFHMLDYLLFLGVMGFLALDWANHPRKRALGLSFLRITAGFSFLWVSVEKWMYPEWAYELLRHDLHILLMGFSPQFFVTGAAFVEFCLAFTLLFGGLASQVAATVLFILLIMAIPLVGVVDAIGHTPILVSLFILATTRNGLTNPGIKTRASRDVLISLAVSILGFIGAYYIGHEIAYSTSGPVNWVANAVSMILFALLIWRVARSTPQIFQ